MKLYFISFMQESSVRTVKIHMTKLGYTLKIRIYTYHKSHVIISLGYAHQDYRIETEDMLRWEYTSNILMSAVVGNDISSEESNRQLAVRSNKKRKLFRPHDL